MQPHNDAAHGRADRQLQGFTFLAVSPGQEDGSGKLLDHLLVGHIARAAVITEDALGLHVSYPAPGSGEQQQLLLPL
jgi:hypothetical protein